MPPKTRKPATRTAAVSKSTRLRRSNAGGQTANRQNGILDVYQSMLDEATAGSSEELSASPRPAKRRKVSDPSATDVDDLFESPPTAQSHPEEHLEASDAIDRPQQIIYDDFEGSDESDIEFEDVELDAAADVVSEHEHVSQKPLEIDLSKSALESPHPSVQRRKPISKAERLIRLDVHKWHLLSLIGHGIQRNAWCNHQEVHKILKPSVPRRIIKLLHVDGAKPHYERSHSFSKAIEELCAIWRQQWKIIVPGLRRSYWREGVDARDQVDDSEDVEFEDFLNAAQTCRGSRDLGAQLFTALLRSVAVEARLVFSLQVLPFTGAAKVATPSKSKPGRGYVLAPAQNYGATTTGTSPFVPTVSRPKKSKKIIDSPYPIFWTEVLTPSNTWIPLDPIVRDTISKPKTQFEPPLSDVFNSMTYVIAYEDDNSARDVTRRYTQWFNAKTRRMRVEGTKNGEQWFESAMTVLRKRFREPRDGTEDDELARRLNSEGMPNNIQDFKNHPLYVLERHMRANEVLQPKREVGKVNVGTAKNGKIESVYRRQDVHLCRSADAWYRRGRDVKIGEQPLKHIMSKARRGLRGPSTGFSDDENEDPDDSVGVYAEYQTDVYQPPPVEHGRIPKNAYGNLDVYVPSMIPPGAIHISHPKASSAAKVVGVDYADAVTGFEFKGCQGTAVVNGIVIAEQFTAAVAATIQGLETLGSEEVQLARSKILLSTWKRMLQALRVRERIETEYGSTTETHRKEVSADDDEDSDEDHQEEEDANEEAGGGFMLEAEVTEEKVQEQAVRLQVMKNKMPAMLPEELVVIPIKITKSPHESPLQQHKEVTETRKEYGDDNELFGNQAGGFFTKDDEDTDMAGGFMADDNETENADQAGGGFMADDDDVELGGGFFPEDTAPIPNSPGMKSITVNTMLHSDTEEDSALQSAIAESLATQHSNQTTAVTALTAIDAISNPSINPISKQKAAPKEEEAEEEEEEEIASTTIPRSASASNSDTLSATTSLMSHDPNEDDDDPEWLDEALDD